MRIDRGVPELHISIGDEPILLICRVGSKSARAGIMAFPPIGGRGCGRNRVTEYLFCSQHRDYSIFYLVLDALAQIGGEIQQRAKYRPLSRPSG